MAEIPSLLSLCTKAVAVELICGDDQSLEVIYELPSDLFDHLLMHLPALALHKLQGHLSFNSCSDEPFVTSCTKQKRKRGRDGDFDKAWKVLFESRWPEGVRQVPPRCSVATQLDIGNCETAIDGVDWQQKYWESHIQDCLDEAAETALLPSFGRCISEIQISETIAKSISLNGCLDKAHGFSKLSYHCQHFGVYARWLRLQNVLCVPKMCELLKGSNLHGLIFRSIKTKLHVDGVRHLLNQNKETLLSLEFIHCKLPSYFITEVCNSLCMSTGGKHGVQYFSIRSSSILECDKDVVLKGFSSFLLSARLLLTLAFSDNSVGPDFARMVFSILLGSLPDLVSLEISDSNIAGCLSMDNRRSQNHLLSSSEKSVKSLRYLNLRGDNFHANDVEDLKCILAHIPNLQSLDISDNPIGELGIRVLIPYFAEVFERTPLRELKLENCDLTSVGVCQFLSSLSALPFPLDALSLADNDLGCAVARPLAKFLGTSHLKLLNVEDIGLGSSGFIELESEMPIEVGLVDVNISKNRGCIGAAKFIARLILQAPELVSVNASYNFITVESMDIIAGAMKLSKGTLKRLDLTGNIRCCLPICKSLLEEFRSPGNAVVILHSSPVVAVSYDDDP